MPKYDFRADHPIARKTEQEVAQLLMKANRFKIKQIEENHDNRFDLKITLADGDIITVEIKEDFTCRRTGNVGLEFECRGRDSGIRVSQADVYLYKLHQPNGKIGFYIIETASLKAMICDKKYHRIVTGGDPGSDSKNYLFKLEVFKKHARLYHEQEG